MNGSQNATDNEAWTETAQVIARRLNLIFGHRQGDEDVISLVNVKDGNAPMLDADADRRTITISHLEPKLAENIKGNLTMSGFTPAEAASEGTFRALEITAQHSKNLLRLARVIEHAFQNQKQSVSP
jgi:hypothetical protein